MIAQHLQELSSLAASAASSMKEAVEDACRCVADAVLDGHAVLVFGNGGSATQASHLAAELVVRYKDDRPALPAIALTADMAILTACANDYDFSRIFSRQIEALGRKGDVAFGLTTSGRSPNVLAALAAAKERGMTTIFVTGEKGREEAARWDVGIVVPTTETAHVQELHLAVIHVICKFVDAERLRRLA